MTMKVIRTYLGDVERGEFLNGVPARSLHEPDWVDLPSHLQVAVDASPWYRRTANSPAAVVETVIAAPAAPVIVETPPPAVVVAAEQDVI